MTSIRPRLTWVIMLGLATSACGGDGVVLPSESTPATLTVVSGDRQSGPAGAALADPLVVRVTDALDRPVEGELVDFTSVVGGGQVAPASVATDANGQASALWTLGSAAGAQEVQAKVHGSTASALTVKLTATALSGTGAALALASGDNQTAPVRSALADSLVVRVTDALGNPVSGVEVQWTVGGGGSISPATVTTGADGLAAAERVLGSAAGTQSTTAASTGLTPVTFTHTAIAANPTVLLLVSGDAQTGAAGLALADSLVVRLEDPDGNGVGSKGITWLVATGGGSVSPANIATDPNGFAKTQWTLGATAGFNQVNAVYSGLPSVRFTATAGAGTATKLAFLQSPVNSSAGTTITPPVRVAVQDANGNTVTTATDPVTLAIETNPASGTLSGTTTVNAVNGVATFSNLSIDKAGNGYTLAASATGLAGVTSTSFDILTGGANRLVFLVQPTNRVVGQPFSPALQVQVQDAGGNPVLTATNQITLTSSVTGALSGTSTATPVLGTATFSNLAISKAGLAYTLTALSSGLVSATSVAFDVAKASTTISITSDNPDPSVVGQTVTINYDVNIVAPGAGSLTGSVTVSDGIQNCVGPINAGTGTGSCQIAFSSASAVARTLTAAYSGDANFNAITSAGVSHAVNKANTTINIVSDAPDSSLVNDPVTVGFTVVVASPGGGTPAGTVTVTASGGTETCSAVLPATSCQIILTVAGSRTLTANYAGDANYNGDPDGDTEPHTVKTPTTTTVTSSGASSVFGQPVTFTATVSPASATGTVQFKVDGVSRDAAVALSGGTAQKIISDLSVGGSPHAITAVYNGSTIHGGSTGTLAGGQTVSQAGTTTTITGDSPDPSVVGAAYTVSVTVAAVAPSTGTPTGSVSVSDGAGGSCSITLGGGSGNCALTSSAAGAKTLTATYPGSASFTGSSDTEAHQVDASNSAPVAVNDAYSVDEDGTLNVNAGNGVLKNDTDADGDPLTAVKLSDPANGSVTLNSNGSFTYTPAADFNGSDSFTYRANDGLANSNTATVTITVNPVNDAPSFTKGADESVSSLAGPQVVVGWATSISKGPANESSQTLTFEVSTDNDGAFLVTPAVSSSGTLTYSPDPALASLAVVTVTVRLRDSGGTASGGVDVSPDQSFTITITP